MVHGTVRHFSILTQPFFVYRPFNSVYSSMVVWYLYNFRFWLHFLVALPLLNIVSFATISFSVAARSNSSFCCYRSTKAVICRLQHLSVNSAAIAIFRLSFPFDSFFLLSFFINSCSIFLFIFLIDSCAIFRSSLHYKKKRLSAGVGSSRPGRVPRASGVGSLGFGTDPRGATVRDIFLFFHFFFSFFSSVFL